MIAGGGDTGGGIIPTASKLPTLGGRPSVSLGYYRGGPRRSPFVVNEMKARWPSYRSEEAFCV
jgi:hypothetical protein